MTAFKLHINQALLAVFLTFVYSGCFGAGVGAGVDCRPELLSQLESQDTSSFVDCKKQLSIEELQAFVGNPIGLPAAANFSQSIKLAAEELLNRNSMVASGWRNLLRLAFSEWDWQAIDKIKKNQIGQQLIGDSRVPKSMSELKESKVLAGLWSTSNPDRIAGKIRTIKAGPAIVIVFHPKCGFCEAAAADISSDEQLRKVFEKHSLWLSFVDINFDLNIIDDWKHRYPYFFPLLVRDWERFGLAQPKETPVMYLFIDGRPVKSWVGWPSKTRGGEIVRAFQDATLKRGQK